MPSLPLTYVSSGVLHRPSAEFNRRGDRERSKGIDMLKIQSWNKTMTQELEEFRKKAFATRVT